MMSIIKPEIDGSAIDNILSRIEPEIDNILINLCKSNNRNIEGIKEYTVELYNDFSGKDILINVIIVTNMNSPSTEIQNAEDKILIILKEVFQQVSDNLKFEIILGKMKKARLIKTL